MEKNPSQFLYNVALLEGTTLISLIFIGLPLKYALGIPQLIQWLGPIHGACFLFYLFALLVELVRYKQSMLWALLAAACAFIPGGTFWLMHQMRRNANI